MNFHAYNDGPNFDPLWRTMSGSLLRRSSMMICEVRAVCFVVPPTNDRFMQNAH